MAFTFLSHAEFEVLSSREKLTYLSDAMEELERTKVPRTERGWDSLFVPTGQQRQQPQQEADPKPPEAK